MRGSSRPSWPRRTASTASATTTTGSTASGCWSGRSTRCWRPASPTSVLPLLGERALVAALGRAADDVCSPRPTAPRTTSSTSAGCSGARRPARDHDRRKPLFIVYQAQRSARARADRRHLARGGRARRPAGHLPDGGRDRLGRRLGRDRGRLRRQGPLPAAVLGARSGGRRSSSGPRDLQVYDYETAWPRARRPGAGRLPALRDRLPTLGQLPARGARAVVMHSSTPDGYGEWLAEAVARAHARAAGARIVFLNAWNEWAEGATSSPTCSTARGYLEATRRALHGVGGTGAARARISLRWKLVGGVTLSPNPKAE